MPACANPAAGASGVVTAPPWQLKVARSIGGVPNTAVARRAEGTIPQRGALQQAPTARARA